MNKELKKIKIADLYVDEDNEKIHTEENLNLIKESINQVGYITPVLVDENHNILSGHGRVAALNKLGAKDVEALVITGLTDAQKAKFRLFENQSARTGYMDKGMVVKTVENLLETEDFDFSILAFDGLVDVFSTPIFEIDVKKEKFADDRKDKACFLIMVDEENREATRDLISSFDYIEGRYAE
jgi:hypothetical protein